MSKQLHKNFTDDQVKSLFEKYSKGDLKAIINSIGNAGENSIVVSIKSYLP